MLGFGAEEASANPAGFSGAPRCSRMIRVLSIMFGASPLRLSVTSGARADAVALKNAVSSAVDIMQGLGSSVRYMLPKVNGRAYLVSELKVIAGQEKAMLDESRELLAMSAKLQKCAA
ncbi:hypothetical protein GUJ93_ZPchr0009g1654 [Zizania palustris]|uniref:Uncharacterized protein n=1 Tax=Zizania palustris TaxID=103762 RepID=A0A8J5RVJ6_ZIZPA|nr:hypothetical protein GUJ93_ZPchr0009g1654 [Zizania palustris]